MYKDEIIRQIESFKPMKFICILLVSTLQCEEENENDKQPGFSD